MISSMLLAISVFLFFLPLCFIRMPEKHTRLLGRIDVEQYEQLEQSFESTGRRRRWKIFYRLQVDKKFAQQISQSIGFDQRKITRSLTRLRWNITAEEVLLAKLAGAILLGLCMLFLLWLRLRRVEIGLLEFIPLIVVLIAFMMPTQIIEWADKHAKEEIHEQIPIFFSIVQALVEAGMPVHTAIRAASKRYEGRLGFEFAQLEIEEKQFGNWRKALEEMAFRWDIDALVSIISEINEALTKGVSIAGLLATQVEEQIRLQEDEASDYANRLSVRLLPFLIVFMGIPLLFLVLGPSFISIKQNL